MEGGSPVKNLKLGNVALDGLALLLMIRALDPRVECLMKTSRFGPTADMAKELSRHCEVLSLCKGLMLVQTLLPRMYLPWVALQSCLNASVTT